LKLNGIHQRLFYVDDVNISCGGVDTGALLFVIKETGLEVNADKTKYMVISRN